MKCKVFFFLALTLTLGGCQMAPPTPQNTPTVLPPYLTEADGAVTLRLSTLLEEDMAVRLKRGGGPTDGEPKDDEVLLNAEQSRALFSAVDAASYGVNPRPMPTGVKGYLWAVRVSDGSVDAPQLFFFLDMKDQVTLVVLADGTQRSLALSEEQGKALDKTFAEIAAQAGLEEAP